MLSGVASQDDGCSESASLAARTKMLAAHFDSSSQECTVMEWLANAMTMNCWCRDLL